VALVAIPSSGVFFTTYENLKHALASTSMPSPAVHAISSSVAQLLNCAIVAPAEVLKQNAQMLKQDTIKKGDSPTKEIMRLLMKDPTKLWRGYTALAARDLPFTALQFPAFEYLKRLLSDDQPVASVFEQAQISGASAGIAGSAAAWVTTPIDVVKTRMMLEAGAASRKHDHVRNLGTWQSRDTVRRNGLQICKEIHRKEGVRGFFRGGLIRATWTIAGNGLFMGCYEGARLYLDQQKAGDREQVGSVHKARSI
jgi:solute carrier family 25 (mitochondrial S-adenosylmethionine transporter), member 26